MTDLEHGKDEGKEYGYAPVANPTYNYFAKEEKLAGFLSQQFPTIANPAPLGLCAFALTTFVLSMMNAGAIVGKQARPKVAATVRARMHDRLGH
jgi:GPR1/FUN34/yaaH family